MDTDDNSNICTNLDLKIFLEVLHCELDGLGDVPLDLGHGEVAPNGPSTYDNLM